MTKLALITGASSGIGLQLSKDLVKKGFNLIIAGQDRARLESLAQLLQKEVSIQIFVGDLSLSTTCERLVKVIQVQVPDLVINNAGLGLYGPALNYSTKSQMQILQVNGNAVLELTLEAARAMIKEKKKGIVMNISSVAGFLTFPNFSVYSSSKAFVTQFSEAFDHEVSPYGVRILTACPGVIQTQFRKRAGGIDRAEFESTSFESMSVEFASQEILLQIEKRKTVYIFDWKYRFVLFCKSLIPKWLMMKILQRGIEKIHLDNPK